MAAFSIEKLKSAGKKLGLDRAAVKRQLISRYKDLVELNKQHYEVLEKNFAAVAEYKKAAAENSILMDMDRKIYAFFHGESGMLFYADILRQYTEKVMKDDSSIEQMHTGAYNSSVAKLLYRKDKLDRELDLYQSELNALGDRFKDKADVFISLGYKMWTAEAKALKELLTDEKLSSEAAIEQAEAIMAELEQAERENRKAAELSVQLSAEKPEHYKMKNRRLLCDAESVLEDGRVSLLANPRKFTEEEYRKLVREFSAFAADTLNLRYWYDD